MELVLLPKKPSKPINEGMKEPQKGKLCEHCGEPLFQHPEDQPWRFVNLDTNKMHWFCSYLCAIRFFKVVP